MRLLALAIGLTLGLAGTNAVAQQAPQEPRPQLKAASAYVDEWPPATRRFSLPMVVGGILLGLTGIADVALGFSSTKCCQATGDLFDSSGGSPGGIPWSYHQTVGIIEMVIGGGLVATGAALTIAGARRVDVLAHPDPPDVPYRVHNTPLLVGGIVLATAGTAVGAVGIGSWHASHDTEGTAAGIGCAGAGLAMALGGLVAIGIGSRQDFSDPTIVLVPKGAGLRWVF